MAATWIHTLLQRVKGFLTLAAYGIAFHLLRFLCPPCILDATEPSSQSPSKFAKTTPLLVISRVPACAADAAFFADNNALMIALLSSKQPGRLVCAPPSFLRP
ncbi:unnamed protein product [Dicrocoelium dendriticum]|nr:unnamed protein product [Dicrocoelium dendriticum]